MASRRITATLTVHVTIDLDEGVEMKDAIDNMDLQLHSFYHKGDMVYQEITGWEVTDSK